MGTRKLVPLTIIPPELYVQREADRQLRRIIDDMGRPACVLVARQMGKTNLLLNAKRELEDNNSAFIYVDLSVPLSSERECFRHIIDTALETRSDVFSACKDSLLAARERSSAAAYKEHELELRSLLAAISGKLVIILDEIDSLGKGTFSDKVFAQIRSVYFSRVNYPQFARLTYVLSGVLEPNEIIKDKRISPFNISEKVYLDDFTFAEFREFLSRAALKISDEVRDRIYYWANGNPRITWDICGDLEEKVANDCTLTVDDVNQTVERLYLKDFNQAPIDHIREIVANDDDLRNAITVVKFDKGYTLPDDIKNKLYLAGITGSGKNYKEVKIKNKVVEAALSDQWLHDIGVKRKGLLKLADEHLENLKYAEALALYEQFIAKNEVPEEKRQSTYYNVGSCAYHVGDYAKAISFLQQCKWDRESAAVLYYELKLMLGICYLGLEKIQDCQAEFNEVLSSPKKDSKYFSALVNLGSSYILTKGYEASVNTYQRVISELSQSELGKEEGARILASTYVNLSNVKRKMGNADDARTCLEKANALCLSEQRPTVLLDLIELVSTKNERRELLQTCVRHILDNRLVPIPPDPTKPLAFTKSQLFTILVAAFELDRSAFKALFEYVATIENVTLSSSGLLHQLAIHSLRQRKLQTAAEFAQNALERNTPSSPLPQDTAFESLRLVCYISKGKKRTRYTAEFVEALKGGFKPRDFSYLDVGVISEHVVELTKLQKSRDALELITYCKKFLPLIKQEELGSFALLYFHQIQILELRAESSPLRAAAQECLDFIAALPKPNGAELLLGSDGLNEISAYAQARLHPTAPTLPIVNERIRKFERNEKVTVRYRDGTVRESVKFKKVEADLLKGLCEVVE